MLSVFICEDNPEHKKRIEDSIRKCIMIYELDMEIALSATDPDELIDYLNKNRAAGLYFLDVHLEHTLNGLDLANVIRKYDPRGFIVFVTTDKEAMPLVFKHKVEAIDFIVKELCGNLDERIYPCVLDAHEKYSSKIVNELQKNFSFTIFNKLMTVEYSKIYYFETSPNTVHKLRIHTANGQYEFYGSLDQIMGELDESFYRCHNSFIINIRQISGFDKSKKVVHLNQGYSCFVSDRKLKPLIKILQNTRPDIL